MTDSITPINLPPHLAFAEVMMATWSEALLAASTEMYHFWCMPFSEPHHHEEQFRFQMELPEPIEEHEHDLFA